MPSYPRWLAACAFIISSTFSGALRADADFSRVAPYPTTQLEAQKHSWGLGMLDDLTDDPLRIGANAVAIITLDVGSTRKQWLVALEVVTPTPNELAEVKLPPDLILHTSTGNRITFGTKNVMYQLQTVGPFTDHPPKAKGSPIKESRVFVNAEHLTLGLDRACAASLRLLEISRQQTNAAQLGFGFGTEPFPADVVAKAKVRGEQLGLTLEDERAFAGTVPALISFFQIASTTPGLQDILKEVIDIPIWSIVKRGGKVDTNIQFDSQQIRSLGIVSGQEHFALPVVLLLNGKPALILTMEVTAPRSPINTTAGIRTLWAHHPTNPKKRVVLEISSARRGNDK